MSWARQADNLRGYVPLRSSALALAHNEVTPPDLAELYTVGRFDDPAAAVRAGYRQGQDEGRSAFFAPNVWPDPDRVPDFKEALNECYAALEDLAAKLMRLMALALDLDEHWFDDKIAEHITGLAVLHYPALEVPPLEGQYRRGPHTDWGSLTILYHDGQPGSADPVTGGPLGGRALGARIVRGESRRLDGRVDERPLGVHAAPGDRAGGTSPAIASRSPSSTSRPTTPLSSASPHARRLTTRPTTSRSPPASGSAS